MVNDIYKIVYTAIVGRVRGGAEAAVVGVTALFALPANSGTIDYNISFDDLGDCNAESDSLFDEILVEFHADRAKKQAN